MISFDLVFSRLNYDHVTGYFTWKERVISKPTDITWNKRHANNLAGSSDGKGYLKISIDNKKYYSHRLAWLYFYGSPPEFTIDHINGNCSDNRIKNLRDVPHKINMRNMRRNKNNKSGYTGIWFNKKSNTWCANLSTEWVGSYQTLNDAVSSRELKKDGKGYHVNHGMVK